MAMKYEALRLFLAGTALILTALLTNPKSLSPEPNLIKRQASSDHSRHKKLKSKSHTWSIATYHVLR